MRALCTCCGLVGLILASATSAHAEIDGLQRVASGLAAPIFVTHAPGDASRLFIAQRSGQIRILDLNTGILQTTAFLSTTVNTAGEGGLLGMAFHPNYFNEGQIGFGKFYLNVTTTGSPLTTRIREFQVSATNPNLANSGSLREILSFAQPQDNHNGGWIGFSPMDNFLYIASGDGGGGDDNDTGHTPGTGNAQDITNNLLGKMLRIDVNGDAFPADGARNYAIPPTNPFKAGVGVPGDDAGDDEIWAYGLRNPFRASFDRVTGDLWIGDVGQSAREEIDFQPASSTGGANYGWRLREGLIQTPGTVGGAKPAGNVDPVYDYDRNADPFGGTVVTGGYVYRGPDPDLRGQYFFLDSRSSPGTTDDNYWMFDPANPFGTVQNIDSLMIPNLGSAQFPVSFGEDARGNLYIAYLVSGEVYRIKTDQIKIWGIDANGDTSLASNWLGGVAPGGADDQVGFTNGITANRVVTVNSSFTAGSISFDDNNNYTVQGPGTITLNVLNGAARIDVKTLNGAGSHTISAPLVLSDSTAIDVGAGASLSITSQMTAAPGVAIIKNGAGTLSVRNIRADALSIRAGAVQVLSRGDDGTSVLFSLTVTAGTFDLTNNDLVIKNGDLAQITGLLNNGRLSSSSATAITALGVIVNGARFTKFSGQEVSPDDVLVKFTYLGDTNFDGRVSIADFLAADRGFARNLTGWENGDFNLSGSIDAADFFLMDQAFVEQGAPLSSLAWATIPEPGILPLVSTLLLALRRSRFRQCFLGIQPYASL